MPSSFQVLVAATLVLLSGISAEAAELVRPLHVLNVPGSASQVAEGQGQQPAYWVVACPHQVTRVDIASGVLKHLVGPPTRRRDAEISGACSPNGVFVAYGSGEEEFTILRSDSGATPALVAPSGIVNSPTWHVSDLILSETGREMFLIADGAAITEGDRSLIIRIDLVPSPRAGARLELERRVATAMAGVTGPSGFLLLTTCDDRRSGGGRFLQVCDRNLQVLHKEQIRVPMWPLAAHESSQLLAVFSAAGGRLPSSRWSGPSRWILGSLPKPAAGEERRGEAKFRTLLEREQNISCAAISPDGQWLVTGVVGNLPVLEIWSLAAGKLHRAVQISGGTYEGNTPSPAFIRYLAISKTGKYLCASGNGNAFLLDFLSLVKPPTPSTGSPASPGSQ